jgi:hypothetical protein
METQTKTTPQSLAELAQALLELANHVERISEGVESADRDRTRKIVDRMLREGADDYIAAFHGITYAWVLAIMPELEDVMNFDAKSYRRTVVLETRRGHGSNQLHNRFEFMLPKSLDYVDDEWAGREVDA